MNSSSISILNITNDFLLDLYKGGSIRINNITKGYSDRRCIHLSLGRRGKNRIISINDSLAIFNFLNLNPYSVTTDELKNSIVNFFRRKNPGEIITAINYLLNRHYKLTPVSKNGIVSSYLLSDKNGIFKSLFDRVEFQYECQTQENRDYIIRIRSGSFFIDGRWIHI